MYGIGIQGGSNMTGTNCDLFTHNQSRSYLNHLVSSSVHQRLCHYLDYTVSSQENEDTALVKLYLRGENSRLVPVCLLKIPHRLFCDSAWHTMLRSILEKSSTFF
jgi:hypothetical protein